MQQIMGYTIEELQAFMLEHGQKKFRANQLYNWVYRQGVQDIDSMTNISNEARLLFKNIMHVKRPFIQNHLISKDGTQKFLLAFDDGHEAEMVYIPESDRGTLCVSSQIGCTLNCTFCYTGTQRMVRNLTCHEIVGQLMLARDMLDDWPSDTENRKITNIVFMGMGEPLYNSDNVVKAIKLMNDGSGLGISRRKITVSTSGIIPDIHRIGHETGAGLAVSLHAPYNSLRDILVPINRKYPLEELLENIKTYPGLNNSHRITWEYVMLKGVNDTIADAKKLLKLIKDIPSKINIIPFNPWPNSPYETSHHKDIQAFADIIQQSGYASPIRTPRGQDILAACGQLKSLSIKQRRVVEKVT